MDVQYLDAPAPSLPDPHHIQPIQNIHFHLREPTCITHNTTYTDDLRGATTDLVPVLIDHSHSRANGATTCLPTITTITRFSTPPALSSFQSAAPRTGSAWTSQTAPA